MANRRCCLWLLLAGLSAVGSFCADAPHLLPTVERTAHGTALPPYAFPWDDGLYGTAAGFLGVKNVCFSYPCSFKLCVSSFCNSPFTVKAVIQDHTAPLVVMLLGIHGLPEEDFSKRLPSWLAEAGFHVLAFESTSLQDFNEHTRHGVSGNLWRETELACDIVAAFLEQSGARARIGKIGVVGVSDGGVEALMLGAMVAQKKVPFEVVSIQSYSPPLNMLHTAQLVDSWYAQTHNQFPLAKLLSLKKHVPDRGNPKSPLSDAELKAALSTLFRMPLAALIAYNDRAYHLNKLPKGDDFDDRYVRESYAEQWGFERFALSMSYPYWQKELNLSSLDPLLEKLELTNLIRNQPSGMTEVILAQDDPLDIPEDMNAFKTFARGKPVIMLPRGGHVGFIGEEWTKAKVQSLFEGK